MAKQNGGLVDKDGKPVVLDKKMEDKRKKAFEHMSKKVMLINLERYCVASFVFDPIFSDQIAKDYGLKDSNLIQVQKCIFNPEHTTNIRTIMSDALLMMWNHTRPWDNVGLRLMPMELFDDFSEVFTKIKDEFEEAVQTFKDNYKEYKIESKQLLGKAYNKDDYPTITELDDSFCLNIQTYQLPDIDDIRLNISTDELLDLEEEIKSKHGSDTVALRSDGINALKNLIKLFEIIENKENKKMVAKSISMSINSFKTLGHTGESQQLVLKAEALIEGFIKDPGFLDESKMMMTDDADLDDLDDFV